MVIQENDNRIDVICAHIKDGKIIPMKIRVVDEDGESQNFVVQEYRILSGDKPHTLGNGVPVLGNQILTYELKIIVLGTAKWIKVMYNTRDMVWRKISF